MVITGGLFTVTVELPGDCATQPCALVPVTVYTLVTDGDTAALPEEKVYVSAPEGSSVNVSPLQMGPLFTVIIGDACTVT
jgi:hypothetical protein